MKKTSAGDYAALPVPRACAGIWTVTERNRVPRNPGGGMMIHRECALQYLRTAGPEHLAISRTGNSLIASEDSDIWDTVLASGLSRLSSRSGDPSQDTILPTEVRLSLAPELVHRLVERTS